MVDGACKISSINQSFFSALKQICSSRAAKRVEIDASVNDASGLDVCLFLLLPEGVGEGELSGPRAIGVDDVAVKDTRAGEDEDSRSCGDWPWPPHGYLRILGQISPLHLFPDLVRDPIGPRKEDLQSESGGLCV